MASALKNIQSNSNSYNLVNQYNSLTEGLNKYRYKNFIKNNEVNFVVKNNSYDLNILDDTDIIDKENFNIPFWYHSTPENNTTDIGILLDKVELVDLTKKELIELSDIPIALDTSNKIYQEINVELRKQTEYVISVEYQIKNKISLNPGTDIVPVTTKNLSIDLTVFNGTVYTPLNNEHFNINETDYKIVNSSNYTYQKTFIIKNLNEYSNDTKFKLILGGTSINNNLSIIVKSANFYEGNVAVQGLTNENSFLDFVNFDDKVWHISNDGNVFNPLLNTNLVTVGIGGKYSTLDEAIDGEGENVMFFFVSSLVTLIESKTLKNGCSIYGNGYSLSMSPSTVLSTASSNQYNTNTIKDIQFFGGLNSLKIDNTNNVMLSNILFGEIQDMDGTQLLINNSKNINGFGLVFENNNNFANKSIEMINCEECNLSINNITNYGYISGVNINGSGVYLQNSNNNKIFINNIYSDIPSKINNISLNAVEQVSSNHNVITILNHDINDNSISPSLPEESGEIL